jgi:hypothetical protein
MCLRLSKGLKNTRKTLVELLKEKANKNDVQELSEIQLRLKALNL